MKHLHCLFRSTCCMSALFAPALPSPPCMLVFAYLLHVRLVCACFIIIALRACFCLCTYFHLLVLVHFICTSSTIIALHACFHLLAACPLCSHLFQHCHLVWLLLPMCLFPLVCCMSTLFAPTPPSLPFVPTFTC